MNYRQAAVAALAALAYAPSCSAFSVVWSSVCVRAGGTALSSCLALLHTALARARSRDPQLRLASHRGRGAVCRRVNGADGRSSAVSC